MRFTITYFSAILLLLSLSTIVNSAESVETDSQTVTRKKQSLLDIYLLAQQNDPTWAAARFSNTAAQEKFEQGKALFRPTVNFNSSYTRSNTDIRYIGGNTVFNNNNQSEAFNTLNYGVNVNQPLYRQQNTVQYQQSTLQVQIADLQLEQQRQELMAKSAQVYFDVLLAQDKLTLNQAQKTAIKGQFAQAKANFKAGIATITDVDESQAKFDLVESQHIAISNEIESKKQAVQILTGQYPSEFIGLQSTISPMLPSTNSLPASGPTKSSSASALIPNKPEAASLSYWMQQALLSNIELAVARLNTELANKEVSLNKAAHQPTLDAVASYNKTNANGGINGFGNDLNNATIGLQLQIPLYQGGAISSKVREAIANQQKVQQQLEVARRKAEQDTRQAYLDITTSISQSAANEQSLRSAQSQLASTNKGFKVGIRTSVDILNAQQQVFNAKRDLLQAQYSYLLGLVKLKYAAGILQHEDLEEVNQQLVRVTAD